MFRDKALFILALVVANLTICGLTLASEKRLLSIKGTAIVSTEESLELFSEDPSAETLPAEPERELNVVFGTYRPPYVFEKTERGLDVEIVQAALGRKGYKVKVLTEGKADGVIGFAPKVNETDACYTIPFFFYDNVAISKAKNNIVLKKVSDLKNYKFMSFENSREILGKDFAEVIHEAKAPSEISNQELQNKMFWNDKVSVIVSDLNIFRYFQKKLRKNLKTNEDVMIHRLFPMTSSFRVGKFSEKKICDDFNRGLAEVKANGRYQQILDQYVKVDDVE